MGIAPANRPRTRWFDHWKVGQLAAVVALAGLLVGLAVVPAVSLTLLWYVLVPLLPATFLLNTRLWRSVCPLATLNSWGNGLGQSRELTPRTAAALAIAGLVLFHLLVPARRFVLNSDATALLLVIGGVGGLAVVLGARFPVRSAFCNALCPVLPIEQVYGQVPLLSISRGRCPACEVCTPRGCLDLAGGKALVQVIGPARRSTAWLATPHGLFIAALPGFIVGYSLLPDGPLATAPHVYATTLGGSAVSVVVMAALAWGMQLGTDRLFPLVGASAAMLYYWFAGPAIAAAFDADPAVSTIIRTVGVGLAALWLWRAWGRNTPAATDGRARVG